MAVEPTHQTFQAFVDRSNWSSGPWDDEPDKIHFVDEDTGLHCLLYRGPVGAWCGYVAITAEHPYFGVDYGDGPDSVLDVHGGVTYSGVNERHEEDLERGIFVEPDEGKDFESLFWIGFDCAHLWDQIPDKSGPRGDAGDTYRDRHYVASECRSLARQLDHIAKEDVAKSRQGLADFALVLVHESDILCRALTTLFRGDPIDDSQMEKVERMGPRVREWADALDSETRRRKAAG